MTRADPGPPVTAVRLTTAQAGELLTALARAANAADDRAAVVALRNVTIWLNSVAAHARAAQRTRPRCPHCHAELPHPGEIAELLAHLAVEL